MNSTGTQILVGLLTFLVFSLCVPFPAIPATWCDTRCINRGSVSDVHICAETKRISFYFVVTDPDNALQPLLKADVEQAIRMVRARFNNAFSLDDHTLEFVGIEPTLSPVSEAPVTVWLIVFGIIIGLIVAGFIGIIITTHCDKMKKARAVEEDDEENEDKELKGTENGIDCNSLDGNEGQKNDAFCLDDVKLTQL
uniref:collectrin-like n=1 Tax=Pristiophorus japonicus TaxID=55135 RepID=UPI00398F8D3D